ncbi:hypothetical protein [Tautonia rosea]|uniref:hypothetical protein n=1 Tax=Tautonia rosea TaxID=2728037 RepID=UPI001475E498|nr:hypothetical protein [Tautonia rosea]
MIVLKGGTDAASMVLFDPEVLPEGYDDAADPMDEIERLDGEGRLIWVNTAADGGYSLGLCIDGVLPEGLAPHAGASESCGGGIEVRGGELIFAGIEYAFRRDDALIRKYPHMGERCKVPSGVYAIALYEMDYPEGFHEDRLAERLSEVQRFQHSLMNTLTPIGCLGALVAVGLMASLVVVGASLGKVAALAVAVALITPALILSRLRPYREARQVQREVERLYPDYVATLERIGR